MDIPPEEIKKELTKILATRPFIKSPLMSRFLQFVVNETLNGNSWQIKEYTIGTVVFNDNKQGYDPKKSASVRIQAIRLRKLLADYYMSPGNNAQVSIELPKGSYKPLFSSVHETFQGKAQDNYPQDTICIVPFTSLLQHSSMDFSVIGFCEYLSEKLSLFEDIDVISFQSVTSYLDEGGQIATLGKELGVSYYLTGNLEMDDEQLMVSFNLFDALSNELIWSRQTSALLQNNSVMETAENISDQIVSSLAGYSGLIHYQKLTNKSHEPPLSNKMANAVFWFYHYQAHHSRSIFYQAVRKLELLLSEGENCSLCLAVLAHLYADSIIYNYRTIPDPLEKSQELVQKAFLLDPDCQHAHLVQGWIFLLTGKKEKAHKSVMECNSVNPNSSTFKSMCSLGLSFLGNYEESLLYLKKAKQLSPIPYWWLNLPEILIALKNQEYEKVIFHARKSTTPPVIFEHIFEMIALYYLGETLALGKLIRIYTNKHPDGLGFLEKAFPIILFDEHVRDIISNAMKGIIRQEFEQNTETRPGP